MDHRVEALLSSAQSYQKRAVVIEWYTFVVFSQSKVQVTRAQRTRPCTRELNRRQRVVVFARRCYDARNTPTLLPALKTPWLSFTAHFALCVTTAGCSVPCIAL